MKMIDVLRIALGNLRRNKLRTTLTVAGVVVGIATIVFLVTLGFGLQKLVVSNTTNLEALKVVTITKSKDENKLLNDALIDNLKKNPEVDLATPILSYSGTVKEKEGIAPVINGVEPKNFAVYDLKTNLNKKFSSDNAGEIMINKNVVTALNETEDQIIGKDFTFDITGLDPTNTAKTISVKLKVIDIIKDDSKGKFGYTPIANLKELNHHFFNIKVKVKQKEKLQEVKKEIESQGFETSVVASQVDAINLAFGVINGVLGAFGMIALFVAAIGIFNTMTISLLERTHEIGIMKAIGGRDKDCSRIFTAEAAIIGFMGGFFGVFSGWGGGKAIELLINFLANKAGGSAPGHLFYTPPTFAIRVVLFAFFVSTFAGIWPARRASKLNPLEALRYE